jgi:hypothetical protein
MTRFRFGRPTGRPNRISPGVRRRAASDPSAPIEVQDDKLLPTGNRTHGNEQLAAPFIFQSCAKDLQTYCAAVTPGNGRTIACIYAREDKVSDGCDAATENGAALLDWFFETVRYVYDQCADDVQKHCVGTEFGGGRIISCLIEQVSALSDACQEVAAEFSGRLE